MQPQKLIEHSFFQNLEYEHLKQLASCADETDFSPGSMIFRAGECACNFYLITSGEIALEIQEPGSEPVRIGTLGAGELLGWSWLFPPYVWHFQARAIAPTKAIKFNAAPLLVACEEDHDFGYELMKRISQVVIHRLQATRKQYLQLLQSHPEEARTEKLVNQP